MTFIGMDVGGTKIAAGLVSLPEGTVEARRTVATGVTRGSAAVLEDVDRLVVELCAEAAASERQVAAIGLGVCELVNLEGGLMSAQTLDWPGASVRDRLTTRVPCVVVEADVRAAALAEARHGAGRGAPVFLYVSVGTGISVAIVIDGRPFPGAHGASGTLASGPLPSFFETSEHRVPLTLEQIASGPAMVDRFLRRGGKATTAQEVLAAAAAGEERAIDVVKSGGDALGASIGWLINIVDPAMVVIGGGLGLTDGLYRESFVASTRRHLWWKGHREIPIVPAATGADAGVLGAALAAAESLRQTVGACGASVRGIV